MKTRNHQGRIGGHGENGAVLYIALIMLILLALIGVVGMQVATMQERMAANYLAANMAFQQAESGVRSRESEITAGGAFDFEDCTTPYDPIEWANGVDDSTVSVVRTRNVSICMQQCSAAAGSDLSESSCNMYRTTAFSRDRSSIEESSSLSAVDTIFIRP
ncbi:MAG TPA: fimbrial protein [Xanthomonadaceae bacterium]|nr:fimbrial protein [Xanthomonadaceae bacterium]